MNGYIQIELGGELRALKFNMHALELIAQRQSTTNIGNLTVFIYAGLCGNSFAISTGTKPICYESFEDIFEWASEIIKNDKKKVADIMVAFDSSKYIQSVTATDKKKVIPSKEKKKK